MAARVKRSTPLLALGLGLLFIEGCYMVTQPEAIVNFLTGGDDELAEALRRAADDWAAHGLDIANYVTIDDGRGGLPVRFASKRAIEKACPNAQAINLSGCTYWAMGDWLEMLIAEDFRGRPADLEYMVKHELIHALVPEAPHTPGDGVFSESRTVDTITPADLRNLARYTRVLTQSEL